MRVSVDEIRDTHARIRREKPVTDCVVAVAVIVSSFSTGSVLCPLMAALWGILSIGIEHLLVCTDPDRAPPPVS